MHTYSIDQIISWFKDGVIWWVLAWTPLRNLVTVPQSPPSWWYNWFSYQDWYSGSDNDWHPMPQLAERFMLGTWRLLETFIAESANSVTDYAADLLRRLLGPLPGWAASFSSWIDNLGQRLGDGVVWWASNTVNAVQRLYDWLPDEIKIAGMSWSTLLDLAGNTVRAWAATTFGPTVATAANAYNWIVSSGQILVSWYNSNSAWLADLASNFQYRVTAALGGVWSWLAAFQSNPKGTITALYGPGLTKAITLALDAGDWLYNLWGVYRTDLAAFLADPGGWIVTKLQAEIERIW